jgi:isoleucyl-tRNA synthetase
MDSVSTNKFESVHLANFPEVNRTTIDKDLETKMDLAQRTTSLVLSLRKKEQIKVRQPLQKMIIPVLNGTFKKMLEDISPLVLSEVNIKEIEFLDENNNILVKKIKPNFKTIGPKYGKLMKSISQHIDSLDQGAIAEIERAGALNFKLEGEEVSLDMQDLEISSEDIPGWLVASDEKVTVAIDIHLTAELIEEGIAREFVNRIQNLRKDEGLEVTDRIKLRILQHSSINDAIKHNIQYICAETLADRLDLVDKIENQGGKVEVAMGENIITSIQLEKV